MDEPTIKIDANSYEWREIREYIKARITYHRKQLESPHVPIERIPSIRAQIVELKALVKANQQDKNHDY